jgi:hypothetical protein
VVDQNSASWNRLSSWLLRIEALSDVNDEREHLNQVFTFLFVTGKALAGEAVQLDLLDHVLKTAPHLWPNVVFALDQYLVTYCCDDGVGANPMHARGVAYQPCEDPDDLLMRFLSSLGVLPRPLA